MSEHVLLLVLILFPMYACADTWAPITSKIPGVQLWTFPSDSYEGDDNEFMRHCNGGKLIYVSILDAPVKCQFIPHPNAHGFYQMAIKTNDNSVADQRLVVVSKKPIPQKIAPLPMSLEESDMIKMAGKKSKLIQALEKEARRNYTEAAGEHNYMDSVRGIKADDKYRRHIGVNYKVPTKNGFLYISSLGLSPNLIGWEIINLVFRKTEGKLQEVGAFEGCILGGFRDLNSDGTPEILATTCDNDEGTTDHYWSLTPKVEEVLSH